MRKRAGWLSAAAMLVALGASGPVRANIVMFGGSDPGAGPSDPRPNSNLAAAQFDAAAALLGPLGLITFEGLPLNQPASDGVPTTIGLGVTVTTNGTDHHPPTGFSYGISNAPNDAINGYNTTVGGSQHFAFVPVLNVGTATLNFSFSTPTQFFGGYLTGLGTAGGTLHMQFNDGTSHDVQFTGSANGGVQFFGFTDAGAHITSIAMQFQNITGPTRDLVGFDDLRFTTVITPEPASVALMAIGLCGAYFAFRRLGVRPSK